MDLREQDKTIAAMLRKRAAEFGTGPATDCPEPQIIAAYYERALDAQEKARQEAHFASCARCQAQLAALARSEPEPRRRFEWLTDWRFAWRWLAPVVATAAAVAIWIAVRPPRFLHTASAPIEVARREGNKVAEAEPSQEKPKELAQNATAALPPPLASRPEVGAMRREHAGETKELRAKVNAPAAVPAPPALFGAAPAQQKKPEVLSREVARGEGPAAGKSEAEEQAVTVEAAPEAPVKAQAQAAAKLSQRAMNRPQLESNDAGKPQFSAGVADMLEVRSREVIMRSPDGSVLWRVGAAGSIERSDDAGKTWSGQFADVNVKLLAGSAPTTRICWIVGRAGAVLRSTDGEHWERATPPAVVDLVGVQARDAMHAIVIAADGRKFSTEDGGKTWRTAE